MSKVRMREINRMIMILIPALCVVESNNDPNAVGKDGDIGILQIREIYVNDINRIYNTSYTIDDCYDAETSKALVTRYLRYYARAYEIKTKKKVTLEIMARMHNGGPQGYKHDFTKGYWEKVKEHINE